MVRFKNTSASYGLISVLFHWLSALIVLALFPLGLWMVSLDYYHPWYQTGPDLHRSFGVVLIALTIMRLIWLFYSAKPSSLNTNKKWQAILAKLIHYLLYLFIFIMFVSGYLITTAKGDSVYVFELFELPALSDSLSEYETIFAKVHLWLAYILMAAVSLHIAAALKHHFINRDKTLVRMFGVK